MIGKILTVYEDVKKGIQAFLKWKRGKDEDKIDVAIDSRNERMADKFVQHIKKKRANRHKQS